MTYGGRENVSQSNEKAFDLWENGVVLSFDFVVDDLKVYYSEKSPQGAYAVIKDFLVKNGFEHLKDSDYKNERLDDLATADLLYHFSRENKWFPFCLKKMDISPNVIKLDISKDIQALRDDEWGKQIFEQKQQGEKKQDSQGKQGTLGDYMAEIRKQREADKKSDTKNPLKEKGSKDRTDR